MPEDDTMPEDETIRGHTIEVFVGISEGRTQSEPATLGKAIHDAGLQAARAGFTEQPLQVVHIEFTAHNPHITQYKVIAAPGI
ncbi:hypothetical protein BH20ACT13_BH20ACT13_22270 [soil metagenome]